MGKTGLHHIHFIADEISKKHIGRLPGCPHDIPVVETDCRYMETPYQLGNFGNGTFSPGIDEAYAVIVEINAQSLCEIAKGAVFRLPFHQDGAAGRKKQNRINLSNT